MKRQALPFAVRRGQAMNEKKMQSLCELILDGFTLRNAIKETFGDGRKFHEAISKDPSLRVLYLTAAETRADLMAFDLLEIADGSDDPQKAKNRIDARKWLASKLKPKVYGDRVEMAVSGCIDVNAALQAAHQRLATLPQDDVDEAELLPNGQAVLHEADEPEPEEPPDDMPDIFK